jgi:hypothetical protein
MQASLLSVSVLVRVSGFPGGQKFSSTEEPTVPASHKHKKAGNTNDDDNAEDLLEDEDEERNGADLDETADAGDDDEERGAGKKKRKRQSRHNKMPDPLTAAVVHHVRTFSQVCNTLSVESLKPILIVLCVTVA